MNDILFLNKEIKNINDFIILDCRAKHEYDAMHIKNARWLNFKDPYLKDGWDNFINESEFSFLMSEVGIKNKDKILVYDNGNQGNAARYCGASARFWYIAKHYGHSQVYILNGGIKGDMQFEKNNKLPKFDKTDYKTKLTQGFIYKLDEILLNFEKLTFIDIRTQEEYYGKKLYGDSRGGHIPGAIHMDISNFVSKDESISFASTHDLKYKLANLHIKEDNILLIYCQVGIRAAFAAIAIRLAGFKNVLLYDGGIYEWSRVPYLKLDKN